MTTNNFGDLILSKEEYDLLKTTLGEFGVVLMVSSTDLKTYACYVRNPYQEVVGLWGNDLEKKLSKEFFDRYNE